MKLKIDFTDRLKQLNVRFNTDFGIISYIDGKRYIVLQIASELYDIERGAEFETVNTYCNAVLETGDTIKYNKVGDINSLRLHPVYSTMQLESYIGHPIHNKGVVVGTLNFSGFEPKSPEFTEQDIQAVRKLVSEIEHAID